MLKRFLGNYLGAKNTSAPALGSVPRGGIDHNQLKILIEFFPIGKKLRYFPEYKVEIVLDTLVLAYCVNGNLIYSGEAIEYDSEGFPIVFHAEGNEEETPVSRIELFQLLVPDTSDLEMKLDYYRRALIGKGRQFVIGNCISLISNVGGKGVSTVDTEVAKRFILQSGPYAETNAILLTPELRTLTVIDQRKKSRNKISIPVMLFLQGSALSVPSIIVDISEGSVRVRVRDRGTTIPKMQQGDEVILEVNLGETERHYTIKGEVIRRASETCVILLEGQFLYGKYSNFSTLDFLELKAGLLNYG